MSKQLSSEQISKIKEYLSLGTMSRDAIASITGVAAGSVSKVKAGYYDIDKPIVPVVEAPRLTVEEIETGIKQQLKRSEKSEEELATALKTSVDDIKFVLEIMISRGALLTQTYGKWSFKTHIESGVRLFDYQTLDSVEIEYGVIGDTHLCNKHARLDVLNAAYDEYEARGIVNVFHTGNIVDGEKPFNKHELIVAPGMDNQLDYAIDVYPKRNGITTHYVCGDDHEGWWQQSSGVEIGKYLQMRAENQGRDDLKYLGYLECDVKLQCKNGFSTMRVLHPGGGSAYATSYSLQKYVESLQGGEKPQIILAGHYHKANYDYPREIHVVQTACCCDQTAFLRKNKIQVAVGFWIIKIRQNSDGIITSFGTEFKSFYDRGFYEKLYSPAKTMQYAR